MKYKHFWLSDVSEKSTIEVTLDARTKVMLIDPANFYNFRFGRNFTYYGGLSDAETVQIKPPYSGDWHLVVDMDESPQNLQVLVEIQS